MTPRTPLHSPKQYAIVFVGLMVLIASASLAIYYLRPQSIPVELPREAYQNLTFPVYFPENPPPRFVLDTSSVSSRQNVLSYKYDYEGNRPVSVSVQPLDTQLDVGGFKPTREITTNIGKGYLVEFDERTTIAITTAKSLVLINAPEKIPANDIEQFASSLRLVK